MKKNKNHHESDIHPARQEKPQQSVPIEFELLNMYTGATVNPKQPSEMQTNAEIHRQSKKKAKPFMKKFTFRLRHKKRSKNKLSAVHIALLALFGFVFSVSGVMLTKTLLKYKQAGDEYGNITLAAVIRPLSNDAADDSPYLSVDYAALEARNGDYMGWIDIPDTVISYPVVRAEDYWEYLYTTFDKVQNNAGCIFADYQCANDFTSCNTILYGHRMNDGSMFGMLKKYFDSDYLEAHKEIHIYLNDNVLIYEVFSVYQAVAADESYTVGFDSDGEYEAWLDAVKSKSTTDTGVSVSKNDKVLMLSTCKGGENDDRTVVFAVLKDTIPNRKTV